MKNMPILKSSKHFLAMISAVILTLTACNEIEKNPPTCDEPFLKAKAGRILDHTDCKDTEIGSKVPYSASDECVTYNYYMNYLILQLSHRNAGFNCCPEKITASYYFSDDTIKIFEKQAKAGCRCECLYDVNYEIRNIRPGIYHLEIYGPITDGINKPQFSCVLNIPNDSDSTFCMTRGFYPWQE